MDEFSKLSSLNSLRDLIKIEAKFQKEQGKMSRFKNRQDPDEESESEEDEEDESRHNNHRKNDNRNRSSNSKKKGPSAQSSSVDIKARNKKRDKKRRKPNRQDYEDEVDEDNPHEEEYEVVEEEEDEQPPKIVISSSPSHDSLGNKKSGISRRRASSTTTTTTTLPTPVMIPNPFYPYPYGAYPFHPGLAPQLNQGNSDSLIGPKNKEKSKSSQSHQEPQGSEVDSLATPSENHNVINVNLLPEMLKGGSDKSSLLSSFASSLQDDTVHNREPSKYGFRRVSFGNMANGLVRRALRSMVYRIFPSIKNVKGVAARGCREVQSIGSFDSIIMPLGLAVTLHPLLLPLVPFLLLALGSIKAIESATCFVSEYFR